MSQTLWEIEGTPLRDIAPWQEPHEADLSLTDHIAFTDLSMHDLARWIWRVRKWSVDITFTATVGPDAPFAPFEVGQHGTYRLSKADVVNWNGGDTPLDGEEFVLPAYKGCFHFDPLTFFDGLGNQPTDGPFFFGQDDYIATHDPATLEIMTSAERPPNYSGHVYSELTNTAGIFFTCSVGINRVSVTDGVDVGASPLLGTTCGYVYMEGHPIRFAQSDASVNRISVEVSGTIEPSEYWPYIDPDTGLAQYDTVTGELLRPLAVGSKLDRAKVIAHGQVLGVGTPFPQYHP